MLDHVYEMRTPLERFCLLTEEELREVAHGLGLCALAPHLPLLQSYYRGKLHRDPFAHELLFLEAFAAKRPFAARTVTVEGVTGDADAELSFSDVCRQRKALGDTATPTLSDVMKTAARYLKRAGIGTALRDVRIGKKETVACCEGTLTLSLREAATTLGSAPDTQAQEGNALLLFTPSNAADASEEYRDFLTRYRPFGVSPLAAVGDEGLWVHLAATTGAVVDLATILDDGTPTFEIPQQMGRDTLFLRAPERALPHLFGECTSVRLLGSLTGDGRLCISRGGIELAALDLSLLSSLEVRGSTVLCATATEGCFSEPVFAWDEHLLIGGTEITGDVQHAVLALAASAWERGARLDSATLAAALFVPDTANVSAALSLALALHRASAELTLPVTKACVLRTRGDVPYLSLFLCAERKEEREACAPQSAAEARDLFFGK